MSARRTLSRSSSRVSRHEPAPSAARTATSCCRPSALTSSRLVTFAQAINKTMPIVPMTTHRIRLTPPTTSCLSGRMSGVIRMLS